MIIDILEGDYKALYTTLFVVSVTWFMVLVAIVIDLHFGILKAKEVGECTTSEGFKRTIKKATYYYALMTFALLFDVFDMVTPYFVPKPLNLVPFFSVFGMLCLVFTEWKSVREKAEDKHRRRVDKSFEQVVELLKNREDVAVKILEHLKEEKIKQDKKTGPHEEKNT